MTANSSRLVSIVLALLFPAAACAQQQSAADKVADQFLADDSQPRPNDPKLARDLDFLNSCTARRIRASDISFGESQGAITAKVQTAMRACAEELYGKRQDGDPPAPIFEKPGAGSKPR